MGNSDKADIDGGPLKLRPSIFSYLEEGLDKAPDGQAVIVMHQPAEHLAELTRDGVQDNSTIETSCLTWTYSQLHRAALKLGAGLRAHGIEPGSRIATIFPSRVEFHLTLFMCSILKTTICPLDPGTLEPARRDQLAGFIQMMSPDVIIVVDQEAAETLDELLTANAHLKGPKIKIVLEDPPKDNGWTTISALASQTVPTDSHAILSSARQDNHSRDHIMLLTSGTSTGNPKVCPRTVASLCHTLERNTYGRGFSPSSRVVQNSANFRAIAQSLTLSIWRAGGTIIVPDPAIGPKGTIAAIRDLNVTFLQFVPAWFHAVVTDPDFPFLDVSAIKGCQLGGEIATRDLIEKVGKAFPSAVVSNGHGMTEGGGLFYWPFYNAPISYMREICPVGKTAPGARVRIRNPETGSTVAKGEPGELCFCSQSLIKSYLTPGFEDSFFVDDADGSRWFCTGDLAVMRAEDEVVFIQGRIKDRIKRAGIPIMPAALESCVEQFVKCQSYALAYPHAVLGQEPVVVCKEMGGRTEEEIMAHVVEVLGKDYALGGVLSLQQLGVETIPLNATGKAMKTELLEMVKDYYRKRDA